MSFDKLKSLVSDSDKENELDPFEDTKPVDRSNPMSLREEHRSFGNFHNPDASGSDEAPGAEGEHEGGDMHEHASRLVEKLGNDPELSDILHKLSTAAVKKHLSSRE